MRLVERKPASAEVHAALGHVYLMARQPQGAEGEFRKAIELGNRNAAVLAALGWALVQQDRLEEALPIAMEANGMVHEDFGVYCLYCGLMAHHGHGDEVTTLFDFLKRRALQVRKQAPSAVDREAGAQFEFARREMSRAGFS
jgi:Tfp pilus assembly protein PilF